MQLSLSIVCSGLLALGLSVRDVEARRFGGGASKRMQRDLVATQKEATGAPSASAGTAMLAPRQNWTGPLAGLAAGIWFAALLEHPGLGKGLANVLLSMLLVAAVVFAFRMLLRRRKTKEFSPPTQPRRHAGVGGPDRAPMPGPGFEAGNLDDIREFATCEMFAEAGIEVAGRHGAAQTTDVATLEAKLLDVAGEPARQVASFRFRSPTRKDLEGAARPFDERWHLARPVADSGDRVFAGIQQLD